MVPSCAVPTLRRALGTLLSTCTLLASHAAIASLPVYQPKVTLGTVHVAHVAGDLPRYNHCGDIVRFKGRFLASWMGNPDKGEGKPGQAIYFSTSPDFVTWSTPFAPFTAFSATQSPTNNIVPPAEALLEWQPAFVNLRDEVLFCAWSMFNAGRTFVSYSTDGDNWTHLEVPSAPESLKGQVVGFPVGHGIVTSKGVIMIPCSLPSVVSEKRKGLWIRNEYQAVLMSADDGKTWQWSEPIAGAKWTDAGDDPARFGNDDTIYHWEFSVFEALDGSIGLVARNTSRMPDPKADYRTVLAGRSTDGGRTWSKAMPIDLDSVSARQFATKAALDSGLLVSTNDWLRSVPEPSWKTRYRLSLFCAPTEDPNLLLPGPLVQPASGVACYPNGFVDDDTLYLAYTYGSGAHGYASISTAKVHPLPDFSRPFLLPRQGREGLAVQDGIARFELPESTLGLVLTRELTAQETVHLSFESKVIYNGHEFPILTLGGKTSGGLLIRAIYDTKTQANVYQSKTTSQNTWATIGAFTPGQWDRFQLSIGRDTVQLSVNGSSPLTIAESVLRKIAFGGLYSAPTWPRQVPTGQNISLNLETIEIR